MAEKKGILHNLIVGKEKDEDYARRTMPSNRWELGKSIFFGQFSKIFFVNLILLVGLLPVIAVVYLQYINEMAIGAGLPYTSAIGVGYPVDLNVGDVGFALTNYMEIQFMCIYLPIAVIFSSLVLSGATYVMRQLVWTEGVSIAPDMWKGIKQNFWQTFLTTVLFAAVLSLFFLTQAYNDRLIYYFGGDTMSTIASVASYILLIFSSIMVMFMLTIITTYQLKFIHVLKNAFYMTVGLLVQNIFFLALAICPMFISLLIPALSSMVVFFYFLCGFSFALLVITNYSQWVFDRFINDRIEGAVKDRGIYAKVAKSGKTTAEEKYRRQKEAEHNPLGEMKKRRAVKPVTDEEITITELPEAYSRADLARLAEEKEIIRKDAEEWANAHEGEDLIAGIEYDENNLPDDDDEHFEGYEEAMLLEGYEPPKKKKKSK